MKVTILDKVANELGRKDEAVLYGFRNRQGAMVLSFDDKEIFDRTGVFLKNKNEDKLEKWKGNYIFSKDDGKLKCVYIRNDGTIKDVELQTFNYATDYGARNQGLIDPSGLQGKTVTVIGLGSGGSFTASDLVRAGVTKMNLIDFDTVSISNLCRSIYDLNDVGKKKTDALYEKLMKINPCSEIKRYNMDLLKFEPEELKKIIDDSYLIMECTDSIKTKMLINGLAYNEKIVIYPAVYDSGRGGDILFTVPGKTPCFECVFRSIIPQMQEIKRGEWDYTTGQAKPMAGLISDIGVVVARSVKLALGFLADDNNALLNKITQKGCSLLLIGNENDFFIFDEAFSEVWAETEINPECICQTLC